MANLLERPTWRGAVAIAAFGLLLIAGGWLTFLVYTDELTGTQASGIATIMLVVLTGVYATTTFLTLRETTKARQQEIRPVFDFQAKEVGSTVVNCGGGPARDLDLTLVLLPAGDSHHLQRQSLPSGEALAIPVEPFSSIGDRRFVDVQIQGLDIDWTEYNDDDDIWEDHEHPYQRLVLTGTCRDVWGQKVDINEKYDVYDLTEGFGGAVSPTLDEQQSWELVALEVQKIRGLLDKMIDGDRE